MKHDGLTTFKIVLWFLASMVLGLVSIAYVHTIDIVPPFSLWQVAIYITIGIGAGILFWWFIMKYVRQSMLLPFAISVGYFFAKAIAMVFGIRSVGWILFVAIVSVAIYVAMVKLMQKSWDWTRRLMPLSNVMMISMMTGIGAMLAAFTPPVVAIGMLVLLACYDAYAVWKSGHMQDWAKEFMKRRIIPGIAVAKEKKEEFALLGGGDVFVIVFVAGSFWKTAPQVAFTSMVGMTLAVLLLFIASKKGKFYPALPFILAGELGVLLVSWVVMLL